ncbi:hypothetical protein SBA1_470029 [Candidatus Sulfotelmatobacter kueseliae]|uniref:Uncharacterized protein n=1 Tax=Candidatus Sulfotelmatobacter kueseliae TaxID=2042962 RepID=A0A2U3KTB5_9BACT|nr:hypothetical protein SBA1_470029 [Candidatus Sulfotelmatobacter kueseliae]
MPRAAKHPAQPYFLAAVAQESSLISSSGDKTSPYVSPPPTPTERPSPESFNSQ